MKLPASRSAWALPFAILASVSGSAAATEGNGSQYAIGVETLFSGMMAPPGFRQFMYYTHYSTGSSKDDAGNDNPRLAYFHFKVDAVATRLSYVWPDVEWLGANVETRAAIAVPTIDLQVGIARPQPLAPLDRSGKTTALGDLTFYPVMLGWHGQTVHQILGVELILPVGGYDAHAPINAGRNQYGIAPGYSVSWLPQKHIDVCAKLRFGASTVNKATSYKSGNEVSVEVGGNYRFNPQVAAGLSGYAYQQISDDRQNGVLVNGNGNRGHVLAAGPSLTVNLTPTFSVMAKVQTEFKARNKTEGTRFWLQARIPL